MVFDGGGEGLGEVAAGPAVGFGGDGIVGLVTIEDVGSPALAGEGDAEFDVLGRMIIGARIGGGIDEQGVGVVAFFFFDDMEAGFGFESGAGEGSVDGQDDPENAAARLGEEGVGLIGGERDPLHGGFAEAREIADTWRWKFE